MAPALRTELSLDTPLRSVLLGLAVAWTNEHTHHGSLTSRAVDKQLPTDDPVQNARPRR